MRILAVEFFGEVAKAKWVERHALIDSGPAVMYGQRASESGVK